MKSRAHWLVAGGCVLMLLAALDLLWPLGFLVYVAFGWVGFLWRVLPQLSIDISAVLYGCMALVGLVVGFHWFCRWLYGSLNSIDGRAPSRDVSQADLSSRRQWPFRWTAQMVALVLVMFCAGISLVGVGHQVSWMATSNEPIFAYSPEARKRNLSTRNLKSIGNAMHNRHDVYKAIPPGFTADSSGCMLHSWQTMILPYIEGDPQSTSNNVVPPRFDLKQPWNAPVNIPIAKWELDDFVNPSVRDINRRDADGNALSHYAGNNCVLGSARGLSLREFTDGAQRTVLAGEAAGNFVARAKPTRGRDLRIGINKSPAGFGCERAGGVTMMMMADGSVKALMEDIDSRVLEALSTPAAGDSVSPEFE